ncbi:hypothetical protein P167DRAFT_545576 [Morchella conica CCBAS932]|uniref:Uncharacterized protein n=1 Tax=Morchella conica CCBAS932 TaxID=1392247 RepID=A0A3N4KNZ1_9PEZI|nr:hypothetical protein P167DRAFT_545576 [Morchella conica CCBAS932]
MFNPTMTAEEFKQTMDTAREGVQQLAVEKEMVSLESHHDELTPEYVNAHMALFKRLIKIVDNVLSVVEDTDDVMEGVKENKEGCAESDNEIDPDLDHSDNLESLQHNDENTKLWGSSCNTI